MMKIYKYEINTINETFQIEMPAWAKVLSFGAQGSVFVMWALVDPHADTKHVRHFYMAFTGFDIRKEGHLFNYIGTATNNRGLVGHLFEVMRQLEDA